MERNNGRKFNELREVKIDLDYLDNPQGSCLFEIGKTKVISAASIQDGVPSFLRNQGTGWVTAEYEMAPYAGSERSLREAVIGKRKGRSQEIQRLIGRVLRSVVDLEKLGERTIWVDCDIIQADGGTRCASITAGFIALSQALKKAVQQDIYKSVPINNYVAAVSVGIVNDQIMLDLEYKEDFIASVDLNLAMTEDGKVVEVQATAEGSPIGIEKLNEVTELGYFGIKQLIEKQKEILNI